MVAAAVASLQAASPVQVFAQIVQNGPTVTYTPPDRMTASVLAGANCTGACCPDPMPPGEKPGILGMVTTVCSAYPAKC